jgi:hypothetical protein
MSMEKARWSLSQGDIGHLSAALQPIRTCREVAEIMDISPAMVCQLENSALRKIFRALKAMEEEGRFQPQESNEADAPGENDPWSLHEEYAIEAEDPVTQR